MNHKVESHGVKLLIALFTVVLLVFSTSVRVSADNSWPDQADGAEAAGFSRAGIARLNRAMEKIVADKDVAGMVWLLARKGEIATYQTRGTASIDSQAPMTQDSLFRIYSMTKPITGVALMILHERGLWDFDDPISKHVPELANLKVMSSYDEDGNPTLQAVERTATMTQLLNHSAGFGYGLGGSDPVNNAFREKAVLASSSLEELIAKVADIPLLYQPGQEWVYSVAVDIQGYIVQKLSGQRFGEFLEENIFQPLGMSDSSFYVHEEDYGRFAEVHNWDADQNRLVQRPKRDDRPSFLDANRLESGGGGLVSSTHDYARFLQMLVNGGELDGNRIISSASVDKMRTNTLRDGLLMGATKDRTGRPGLGFGVDFAVLFDPEAANSPQGTGTYYWSGAAGTWFWIDPTEDMFFIGMIQARGARRPGAGNMRTIARDIIYADLAD